MRLKAIEKQKRDNFFICWCFSLSYCQISNKYCALKSAPDYFQFFDLILSQGSIIGIMKPNGQAIKLVGVTLRRTGQSPSTLARKLSRRAPRERSEQRGCKEGTARVFAVQVQDFVSITSVAVQI